MSREARRRCEPILRVLASSPHRFIFITDNSFWYLATLLLECLCRKIGQQTVAVKNGFVHSGQIRPGFDALRRVKCA